MCVCVCVCVYMLLLFVVVLLWKPYRPRPHYRESKKTISFCRNECTEERERRSLGSSFHNKVLKNAGLFAPADLLTCGIISEVYVCALVVRCVL